MRTPTTTRRDFVKTTATATAMTALSASRVFGANERIKMGAIGVGGMGKIGRASCRERVSYSV